VALKEEKPLSPVLPEVLEVLRELLESLPDDSLSSDPYDWFRNWGLLLPKRGGCAGGEREEVGGDRGARTPNLGIANAALSQLSYIPRGTPPLVFSPPCSVDCRILGVDATAQHL
jgi:hypothetical protein